MGTDRRAEGTSRGTDLEGPKEAEEDTRPLNALCKRLSEDGVSRKVGAFPGLGGRGVSWGRGSTAQRTQCTHACTHTFTHALVRSHVWTHVQTRARPCEAGTSRPSSPWTRTVQEPRPGAQMTSHS